MDSRVGNKSSKRTAACVLMQTLSYEEGAPMPISCLAGCNFSPTRLQLRQRVHMAHFTRNLLLLLLPVVTDSFHTVLHHCNSLGQLHAEPEDLVSAAAKLRDEADALEKEMAKTRPTLSSAPIPAPIVEHTELAGSRWVLNMDVSSGGRSLKPPPLTLELLRDGYTHIVSSKSEASIISKVWGWDVEDDDGTNPDLKRPGLKLDVLLFSADVSQDSFPLLPEVMQEEVRARDFFQRQKTDIIFNAVNFTFSVRLASLVAVR